MSIGTRIKEKRIELKLSRNDLADAIGVSPSAIANYENEISTPKIELMYKILIALKCDANYLYQDDMVDNASCMDEKPSKKYRTGDILKYYRNQSNISVKEISDILVNKGFKASEKTIYSWESGNSSPPIEALLIMCNVYGIENVLETFGYNGYKPNGSLQLNIHEIELVESYRKLDHFGKELITLVMNKECERVSKSKQNSAIKEEKADNKNIVPLCQYPYVLGGASAGATSFMTDVDIETIQAPAHPGADFVISVSGDSMEPTFYDGDKVYIKKVSELNPGDIGIFMVNGSEIYIKEYGAKGLISHNKKYKIISPKEFKEIQVVGKVLGKIE